MKIKLCADKAVNERLGGDVTATRGRARREGRYHAYSEFFGIGSLYGSCHALIIRS